MECPNRVHLFLVGVLDEGGLLVPPGPLKVVQLADVLLQLLLCLLLGPLLLRPHLIQPQITVSQDTDRLSQVGVDIAPLATAHDSMMNVCEL